MPDSVGAALIAGAVSFAVTVVTIQFDRRKLKSEERRHERDLMRRLTEKMLDLRLNAYPQAFQISDQLRGEFLFCKGNNPIPPTPAAIQAVLDKLQDWYRAEAGFLLTPKSIDAYRALRKALAVPPAGSVCSPQQLNAIWVAKNELRGALKRDLQLLYEEDKNRSSS